MKDKKVFSAEFFRKYGILMVLVFMWVLLLIVSPTFRTLKNAENILRQVSVNGILAIGMTFVIMTGGIDLTVGALVAVVGVISGSILSASPNMVVPAVLAGIAICALFGAINGYFVAYIGVPAFVATLAMQTIARGFAYVYSNGKPYTLLSPSFSAILSTFARMLSSAHCSFTLVLAPLPSSADAVITAVPPETMRTFPS